MTGAEVVARALKGAGVARVFASADADVVLVDALRRAGLRIVVVRSGASACTMAAVTGVVGEAPGAAIVGGGNPEVSRVLAEAVGERAPAVVVASRHLGPGTGATSVEMSGGGEVKVSVGADAGSAEGQVAYAVRAAMDEPPGPVWLAIEPGVAPREVATRPLATRPGDVRPASGAGMVSEPRPIPIAIDGRQLDAVAERLAASQRPLVVAGRQCRAAGSAGWLRAFAEALPAPVLVTRPARGVLPDPHPLAFGLLRADAAVLARADVVVALGVDPIELERVGVTLTGPVLRLGRGAAAPLPAGLATSVDRDGPTTVVAEGDVPALLEELAPRLRERVRADWDVAELDRLRRAIPAPAVGSALAALVTRVREATPAGTAAVFSRVLEPLTALWQATGPGELIVADSVVPAAIAVALARPDAATVVFARGDDDLLVEMGTAADASARVIVLVIDGRELDDAAIRAAGAGPARPLSLPALAVALGSALEAKAPTVIVAPATGDAGRAP
jgi:acetolactate synthase-1/2/3 large subunit